MNDAVVTVTAHLNNSQRQATKDTWSILGLNLLRVINEPNTAMNTYHLDEKRDGKRSILIYDVDGDTFDVSSLTVEDGIFEVTAKNTDTSPSSFFRSVQFPHVRVTGGRVFKAPAEGVGEPCSHGKNYIFANTWNKTYALKFSSKMLTDEIMDKIEMKMGVPHQSKQLTTRHSNTTASKKTTLSTCHSSSTRTTAPSPSAANNGTQKTMWKEWQSKIMKRS